MWRPPRPARRHASWRRVKKALTGARKIRRLREFFDEPPAGAEPRASLPASRSAHRALTPASWSPISKAAGRRRSTRKSTAGAAWPRTTAHQILQDPPRCRAYLVHASVRQPVFTLLAHRSLLVDVGVARRMPRPSRFSVAKFDTLRLHLVKIAVRVVGMKTQIRLHLPASCPNQAILRIALGRTPRFITSMTGHSTPLLKPIHRKPQTQPVIPQ